MKKILLVLLGLCFFVLVTGAGAYLWGRQQLARSLPRISGRVTLDGISEQVDIYRDLHGIPHIYAQNLSDLMFAVGYVTAQDRLWQMDLMRRAATGHLAEIFGESQIGTDLLMRTLGLEHIAERQQKILSPQGLAALRAFSDGVNAGADSLRAPPPEFLLLGYEPDPWKPTDTLAIMRLLGWQLSKNFESEIVMARLVTRLGLERATELGPTYPDDGPFIIPPDAIGESIEESHLDHASRLDEIVGAPGGSNSWVIGPELTRSGAPILANDPHLSGTRMPSLWYFAHLVGGDYDVIGGIVPGTPLPLLGHNRRVGWALTNMTADVQDVFIERTNPDDPRQYEYNGRWVDMDTRMERINFRTKEGGQSRIDKEIRLTIHGPIMNDVAPGVSKAVSLSWTGFEITPDFEALATINQARSWDEFRRALSRFGVAPQNFIYADIHGNIGYYGAGVIPVRSSGNGAIPQNGWTDGTGWNGRIPFEQLPHILNPPEGYIVTANNRVIGDGYEHFISAYWAPRFRYQRIAELVESESAHDVESVARIQADTRSLLAELLLESLRPVLEQTSDPLARQAVDYLKEWNYDNSTDSVAATIYHEFLLQFARNTFADELGAELAEQYLERYYLWLERFVGFVQEGSHWFDDAHTEQVEDRDDIAARSLKQAVKALRDRLGDDMSGWRWGDVHRLELRHPLDRNPLAKMLFNLGPYRFPGDGESVNRGAFAFNEPYGVTMAASIRHIMDFSRLNETLGIHTTGQSGNPLSPHYRDFAGKWLKVDYITLKMDLKDYVDQTEGYLMLAPAGPSGR